MPHSPASWGLRHVEQAEQLRHGAAVELHPGARGTAAIHSESSSPATSPMSAGLAGADDGDGLGDGALPAAAPHAAPTEHSQPAAPAESNRTPGE